MPGATASPRDCCALQSKKPHSFLPVVCRRCVCRRSEVAESWEPVSARGPVDGTAWCRPLPTQTHPCHAWHTARPAGRTRNWPACAAYRHRGRHFLHAELTAALSGLVGTVHFRQGFDNHEQETFYSQNVTYRVFMIKWNKVAVSRAD